MAADLCCSPRHKGAEENGSRRRCDPPTQWQSSTVGDARLQNNSLVVIGVSYSVCIQEVFVEHSHLFAVEGPSPPWGSGGGTAQKKHSDTTSKLLKGWSKLFLMSELSNNINTVTILYILWLHFMRMWMCVVTLLVAHGQAFSLQLRWNKSFFFL